MGTVGPGEGCPVSVGELDGTKDKLGWLDGEFETLGAELGTPSNPLSLAPSPSLSNTLDPSPPWFLSVVESDMLPSEQTADRSTQKDPTVPTERHARPRSQSLLVLHVATHFSLAQRPDKQSVASSHVSPSWRGRRQMSSHRPVMQSTSFVQSFSKGILHTPSWQVPDSQSRGLLQTTLTGSSSTFSHTVIARSGCFSLLQRYPSRQSLSVVQLVNEMKS